MPVTRWLRYTAVGAVATALHWATLVLLVERAAWAPAWASGAGALLGAQWAFWGNRYCTFQHRGPWLTAWARFHATAGAGALVGMGVVAAGAAAGWPYLLAQALATGLVLVLGFAVNQAWTFRRGARE